MRESSIENYLVERVKALGGEVRKVKWVGRNGAPDRIVLLAGNATWIELKATGENPKPNQVREHVCLRKAGQRVVVIDSFEGVDEVLSESK